MKSLRFQELFKGLQDFGYVSAEKAREAFAPAKELFHGHWLTGWGFCRHVLRLRAPCVLSIWIL